MLFLSFVFTHLHFIGWPAVIAFLWKGGKYFARFEDRMTEAENTLKLVATNHLPHLEQGLRDVQSAVEHGFANLTSQLVIMAGKKD